MGKLFCIMGKSGSGKDTVFQQLAADEKLQLRVVVPYTTRPARDHETEGVEYHFTDEEGFQRLLADGRVIEHRAYQTVHGLWRYFTVDDGQIRLQEENCLIIGTLEAYRQMLDYFGEEKLCPLYLEVEDGLRLSRALARERQQKEPHYAELCRRFLADCEDFSEEKIKDCFIAKRYVNINLDSCLQEIRKEIEYEKAVEA